VPILPEGVLSFHVIPTGQVVADVAASMASVPNVRTSSLGAPWSLTTMVTDDHRTPRFRLRQAGQRCEPRTAQPWRYVVTDDHSTPNLDLGLGLLAPVERT